MDKNTPIKFGLIAPGLRARAEVVAKTAADNADSVDSEGRFPAEAFTAARAQRLLGMMVPPDLGGEGASISDVADVCYMLGCACASTGMIFAMHQIMVAILVRHAQDSSWHRGLLQRLLTEQLLIASSTTEGQTGGDLRSSECAVEQTGSAFSFTKSATVMSYGAQADAILTTARRSVDAPATDQVLLGLTKEDYQLEPILGWQTLGMRGTCSAGFQLKATGKEEQVLPDSYAIIQSHTMMPVAHLTWGSVWCGIAAGATERARRFVRIAARRAGGQLPPGAAHLTRATMSLRALRGMLASALERFEAISEAKNQLDLLDFQNEMNLLKVNASEMATAAVMSCMQTCGLSGYRNDGEFSVSRHLRDVLSASIMINNDRILASAAIASPLIEVPSSVRG
ncbi:MAG TPA: acyl-CoA dehydrogenase family protein [Candidatus Binataceae bacterium]|nr:acyl-CoA dehydrogenase family protein [Candidatus Binataceae bacterium]